MSFYPLPLLKAILEGMSDTAHADEAIRDMAEHEYDVAVTPSLVANVPAESAHVPVAAVSESFDPAKSLEPNKDETKTGEIPKQGGGTAKIIYSLDNVRGVYR